MVKYQTASLHLENGFPDWVISRQARVATPAFSLGFRHSLVGHALLLSLPERVVLSVLLPFPLGNVLVNAPHP
jgi:hypothetical protein